MSEEVLPETLPDRLLDDAGAAELLNVPKSWVGEAARAGRPPHVKFGRYRRFDRAELLEWVAEQKAGGAPEAKVGGDCGVTDLFAGLA